MTTRRLTDTVLDKEHNTHRKMKCGELHSADGVTVGEPNGRYIKLSVEDDSYILELGGTEDEEVRDFQIKASGSAGLALEYPAGVLISTIGDPVSIPNDTATKITTIATSINTFSDATFADSAFTVPKAGIYRIDASVCIDDGTTDGTRTFTCRIGDTDALLATTAGIDSPHTLTVSGILSLEEEDVISFYLLQNSGGALDILDNKGTYFHIQYSGSLPAEEEPEA